MRVLENNRKEIAERLKTMGDYVKMEYLLSCLKKPLDFDTKKFVLVSLSMLYESRKMYLDAGKMMRIAADINTSSEGKVSDFMKSVESLIKGDNYAEADVSISRAINSSTNEKQRREIKMFVRELYKKHAQEHYNKGNRKRAVSAYERLLHSEELEDIERREVKERLLNLYENLGKMKEYFALKRFA